MYPGFTSTGILNFTFCSFTPGFTVAISSPVSASYNFDVYKQMCFEYGKITGTRDTTANSEIVYIFTPDINREETLMKVFNLKCFISKSIMNFIFSFTKFSFFITISVINSRNPSSFKYSYDLQKLIVSFMFS